ncbi:MAG: DNA recombination protein RmuC, partial [Actinomycetota bacterium]
MYVPAEGVYAEVLRLAHQKQPLFETAIQARVVPMSPLTLYGYLQTVLYGLRCLSVEEGAQEILANCGRLQQDFERFASEYETLGRHLGNARGKYEEGFRRLDRFRDKLGAMVEASGEDELHPGTDPLDRPPLEAVKDWP